MATSLVIADNSPTIRAMLADGLASRGFTIAGVGADGLEAVRLCQALRPSVLSLDFMMPELDAFGVLRELRKRDVKVPTVVVSSVTPDDSNRAVRLLQEGALDILQKPLPGAPICAFLDDLAVRLRQAASARVELLWPQHENLQAAQRERNRPRGKRADASRRRLVIVAASTGGPPALHHVLPDCFNRIGHGMIVIQHMPARFTTALARRLDAHSSVHVREAVEGDLIRDDTVLVAPGGKHMRLTAQRRVALTDGPRIGGLRPRADLTLRDAARHFGDRVLLVVLTGMGNDGVEGAREVRRCGGHVIAESAKTAIVYGMPRAVIEAGLADEVLPLGQIAAAVCREGG